jgi:hypothetical protein
MNIKDLLTACKTYWLQLVAIVSIVSSVFGWGISSERLRVAKEQVKKESQMNKDTAMYYYSLTVAVVKQVMSLDKGRNDTTTLIYNEIKSTNNTVSLLANGLKEFTDSYRQSLALNPHISKADFVLLTQSIDNLVSEVKASLRSNDVKVKTKIEKIP